MLDLTFGKHEKVISFNREKKKSPRAKSYTPDVRFLPEGKSVLVR